MGDIDLRTGGTRNIGAYDAFLAGRSLMNQLKLILAIEQLEKAVAPDPEFANAWGDLAQACITAASASVARAKNNDFGQTGPL